MTPVFIFILVILGLLIFTLVLVIYPLDQLYRWQTHDARHPAGKHFPFIRILSRYRAKLTPTLRRQIAVGCILIAVGTLLGTYLYLKWDLPRYADEPVTLSVTYTPERLARGEYLAEHVAHCFVCHSPRQEDVFSLPVVAGQEGAGSSLPKEADYFPNHLYTPNLTPYHLSDWTDREIYRAITQGVSKDGRALHPVMPYAGFSRMQQSDVEAIIAYLRRLPSVENDIPTNQLSPKEWIRAQIATREADPFPAFSQQETVLRGEYLVTIAGCALCHTPTDAYGRTGNDRFLAGGNVFTTPSGMRLRTPNLTPHASGLGNWSEQAFLNRFATYHDQEDLTPVEPGGFSTVMPWHAFANMEPEDLSAIYDYLQTIPPVDHAFERIVEEPDQRMTTNSL
ncbi:c-type cytochrome [Tunicatimonas pelagia]|uniref:c-type cytochrome n=1 Tax=Tunicatimonas pelagia TaxID=931531 RepID=UPI0026650622|nr:cytochrome c [Tunicatimonas pelagia]WKN44816.1 cytochrome c [Tunicatimonas pelagia]